jgi:hypothetical protein
MPMSHAPGWHICGRSAFVFCILFPCGCGCRHYRLSAIGYRRLSAVGCRLLSLPLPLSLAVGCWQLLGSGVL